MEWREYQDRAAETAVYPDRGRNFLYPALGLADEWGEVATLLTRRLMDDDTVTDEGIADELGDVAWYFAALCSELGLSLEDLNEFRLDAAPPIGTSRISLVTLILGARIAAVAGHAKKAVRDDGGVVTETRREAFRRCLAAALDAWILLCETVERDTTEVLSRNAEKLKGRQQRGTLHGSGDNR